MRLRHLLVAAVLALGAAAPATAAMPAPSESVAAPLPQTYVQVAQHAKDAGFVGWQVVTAVAVSRAESGHNAYAINVVDAATRADGSPNPAYRSLDIGLMQFNTFYHPAHKIADLLDPAYSMRAARALWLWRFNATTGTYAEKVTAAWSQWVVYQTGAHEPYLGAAVDAARTVGAIS